MASLWWLVLDEIGASGFRDEGMSSYLCDFMTNNLNGFPACQVTLSLNVSSDLWLPNGEITPLEISFTQGAIFYYCSLSVI